MPAVVVGAHADHLVCDLCLLCELSLGESAHVDDAATPCAVHVRLSTGAELRSLHAHDGALVVQTHAVTLEAVAALAHDLGNTLVEGIGEADVADHAALEEGERADALGAVNDLVGDDEVAGLDLFLEGAYGAEGDDGADTEATESGDVGAGGNLVRSDLVVETMAGDEGNGDGLAVAGGRGVVEDGDGRGGLAPGSVDVEGGNGGEAGKRLEAGTTDHRNGDLT